MTSTAAEIWVLGATGRSGRAIAARLAANGAAPVLVGRDPVRLAEVASAIGGVPRVVVTGPVAATATTATVTARAVAALLAAEARPPAVVVNTIGPFTETAAPIARACPPGTHYVDLANELPAVTRLLALHQEAMAAGRCLVTGAGFGVTATESVVLMLCTGRPAPVRVRVDALPASGAEPDGAGARIGSALAASVVDALAVGGRRYEDGRLVRTRLGGDFERFELPDGSAAHSAGGPSGELEAARRASGAPFVVAASGAMPAGRVVRAVLPAAAALLARPVFGDAVKRRFARASAAGARAGRRRSSSWARAQVEDADGAVRVGWLRTGAAGAFTSAAVAEVARRLATGEGRPGAWTPGALFGPELAEAAGGCLLGGS